MDLTPYYGKGRTGLANLGNTCFLNSCIQVLNHTYELTHFLNNLSPEGRENERSQRVCTSLTGTCKGVTKNTYESFLKPDIPEATIFHEWCDLQRVMWGNNGVVSPNRFVYHVQKIAEKREKDIFTGWAQNDLSEFLLFLVDCMHNSISRGIQIHIQGVAENPTDKMALECYNMLKRVYSKEYSEIMDLFYGVSVSELATLDKKKTHSITPEMFFILDLPLPPVESPDLNQCMDAYVSPEILNGDNAWFNPETKEKEDVQKRITFWSFPKILVITLKRFSPDGTQKRGDLIPFPIDRLDLSKYVEGYEPEKYVYELYGVCNHIGNVWGGHYTAFVKTADKKWLHFNDTTVEILDSEEKVVTPMAYCLFYRKKNNLV
jgi:ubiquitin carboxyl-terminal hydrolase 8